MRIVKEYNDLDLNFDLIEIINALYIGDFVIQLQFNNGVSKHINFKPFLEASMHPSIKKYLDEAKFKSFKIVDGNLNWNNYELIFPLEDLLDGKI